MSEGWDSHQQAALIAQSEMNELALLLQQCNAKQEQCASATVLATGDQPRTEASRIALENVVAIGEEIDRAVGMITVAQAEMARYANGF